MFTKLLKHEWRASRGILGALSLAALGVGILGAVVCRILFSEDTLDRFQQNEWVGIVLPLLLVFVIFSLVIYALGSQFLLLHRFYKSKFTDEGYLTFTLPVSSRQIFLAAFTNMTVWMLISAIISAFACFIMIFGGLSSAGIDLAGEFRSFGAVMDQYRPNTSDILHLFLSLLSGLVSMLSSVMLIMTCVTLGAVLAKKHKLLAAFGIYYLGSMVYSVVYTAIMTNTIIASESISDLNGMILLEIGLQILFALGGFFLSTHLMDKKLNLP